MLFNSLQFLLFFTVVTSLYFAFNHRSRVWLLLLASCWFYMAFIPAYIAILAFTIIIDYYAGIWIERLDGKSKKVLLIVSIISNIGILCTFKYMNFFIGNINAVAHWAGFNNTIPLLDFILPIGLSFHTFQALSYTIEVYRGNQRAEKSFSVYALYVMFYPQLVAGPIERPQNMLHQFHEVHAFDRRRFREGILIILGGVLKKVVVADRLALLVDPVYDQPYQQTSANLVIATLLFAIQIYCDFSAYSEIAYGAAHLMGFRLMENFRTPYFAASISEFWSRWHISLSTWFKDYVYIPMGGNRVAAWRVQFNLLFVFLVSGFWHGADWGYIVWGGIHGGSLVGANLRKRWLPNFPKMPYLLNVVFVFLICCFAWVFFRAASLGKSKAVLLGMLHGDWRIEGMHWGELIYCVLIIALLFAKERRWNNFTPSVSYYGLKIAGMLLLIYFFGVFSGNQFIYFQF